MKTATDADLLTELTTDPEKLGYRNPDGSWKTTAEIGHLLISNRIVPDGPQFRTLPCRATELWDGGAIDLKRIARVLRGPKYLDVMLAHTDISPEQHEFEIGKAAAEERFRKGEITGPELLVIVAELNIRASGPMARKMRGLLSDADQAYLDSMRARATGGS